MTDVRARIAAALRDQGDRLGFSCNTSVRQITAEAIADVLLKLQPRYNRAGTSTSLPLTRELYTLAAAIKSNPEWIRGTVNGGPCAGEVGNWLTCQHHNYERLCGDPECEAVAARGALELVERKPGLLWQG